MKGRWTRLGHSHKNWWLSKLSRRTFLLREMQIFRRAAVTDTVSQTGGDGSHFFGNFSLDFLSFLRVCFFFIYFARKTTLAATTTKSVVKMSKKSFTKLGQQQTSLVLRLRDLVNLLARPRPRPGLELSPDISPDSLSTCVILQ